MNVDLNSMPINLLSIAWMVDIIFNKINQLIKNFLWKRVRVTIIYT